MSLLMFVKPELDQSPLAPATYLGWQKTLNGAGFELYNLTADVEGHPKGSTVSARTLRDLGYRLPPRSGRRMK